MGMRTVAEQETPGRKTCRRVVGTLSRAKQLLHDATVPANAVIDIPQPIVMTVIEPVVVGVAAVLVTEFLIGAAMQVPAAGKTGPGNRIFHHVFFLLNYYPILRAASVLSAEIFSKITCVITVI